MGLEGPSYPAQPGFVSSLGTALPSAVPSVPSSSVLTPEARLPSCFSDVERLRPSMFPAHRKILAALDAVHESLPKGVRGTASVYLAVIVASLERLVCCQAAEKDRRPKIALAEENYDEQNVEGVKLSKKMKKKLQRLREKKGMSLVLDRTETIESNERKGSDDGGSGSSAASLVYLMALALKASSAAVINARADPLIDVLLSAYYSDSRNGLLTRHLTQSLAGILALLGPGAWKRPQPGRAYNLLLVLATSSVDSKTRRKARLALTALSQSPSARLVSFHTSKASVAFLIKTLTDRILKLGTGKVDQEKQGLGSFAEIIHALSVATVLVPMFQGGDAGHLASALVEFTGTLRAAPKRVPHHITLFILELILALLNPVRPLLEGDGSKSEDQQSASLTDLRSEISATILENILSSMGNTLDEIRSQAGAGMSTGIGSVISAYCMAYSRCAISLCEKKEMSLTLEINGIVKRLVGLIEVCATGYGEIVGDVAKALSDLLATDVAQTSDGVLSELQNLLNSGMKASWTKVLWVLKRFMENSRVASRERIHRAPSKGHIGSSVKEEVKSFIRKMIDARENAIVAGDKKTCGLMEGLCAAILRGGGAEIVLDVLEFGSCIRVNHEKADNRRRVELTGVVDKEIMSEWVKNDWLLPLIRDNTKFTHLDVYLHKLLPLVGAAEHISRLRDNEGKVIEGKIWRNVSALLCSCLAAFCKNPPDLGDVHVMNKVYRCISLWIEKDDLDRVACGLAAIRALGVSISALEEDDPLSRQKRSSFAKYLKSSYPKIFKVARKADSGRREPLLDCLTKAASATRNAELVAGFLKHAIAQLLKASIAEDRSDETNGVRHAAADIAISLAESGVVPSDSAEMGYLLQAMAPLFDERDDTILQKKAYRAVTLLISAGAVSDMRDSVKNFIDVVAKESTRANISTSAKVARLNLIRTLIEHETEASLESPVLVLGTKVFIPEIVMCTREHSERTRQAAFGALIAFARAYHTAGETTKGIRKLLTIIAAGLASKTAPMIAATLVSLGKIIYDFRGEAMADKELAATVDSFFACCDSNSDVNMDGSGKTAEPGVVGIMLRHSNHEVQRASLGLVKLATSSLGSERLTNILPGLIPGLVAVAATSRKHDTRLRVRVILERLLRKCGRESLEKVFPEQHSRLLAAVRKKYVRDLTKKQKAKERSRAWIIPENMPEAHNKDAEADQDEAAAILSDSDSDLEAEILDGNEMQRKRTKADANGELRMREEKGQVVDLLNGDGVSNFLTKDEVDALDQRLRRSSQKSRGHPFKIADDGRPIFIESDADSDVAEHGSLAGDSDHSEEDVAPGTKSITRKRRKPTSKEEPRRKRLKGSFGEEYRSRRAPGDVKRIGRPDPYAYIPLGPRMADVGVVGIKRRKKSRKTLPGGISRVKATRILRRGVGRTGKNRFGKAQREKSS